MSTLAIQSRTLENTVTPRDSVQTMHLEQVRDRLLQRRDLQEPEDIHRSADQIHVDFTEPGRAKLHFINQGGLDEPMLLTETGLKQLGAHVLPNRGVSFLEDLAGLGEHGRKLATANWAMFSRELSDPRMVRTVKVRDPQTGEITRAVRSVMSQGYGTYDNVTLVDDLLNSVETRHLPVLAYQETDRGIRLRMALDGTEEMKLNEPVRMLEAWNSEVGLRSAGIQGGIFKLWCTNGCGTWDKDGGVFRFVHRGDSARISKGISDGVSNIRVAASGVLDAYNAALDVAIDDAYLWLGQQLKGTLTRPQIQRAQTALNAPTSQPNLGTLAGVVDALTLSAQDESSMFAQSQMEQAASQLLRKGLNRAGDSRELKAAVAF